MSIGQLFVVCLALFLHSAIVLFYGGHSLSLRFEYSLSSDSIYPFRLFGAEVWQTDKHRSDKRQGSGQAPKRIVAWIFLYNMDYNVMYA